MKRREFFTSSVGLAGTVALTQPAAGAQTAPLPAAPGLTRYVSEFIVNTRYEDIPQDVLNLGRKSILDGFGLALAGSVSEMGPLVRRYVGTFAGSDAKAGVIGTRIRVPVRFAALANGI